MLANRVQVTNAGAQLIAENTSGAPKTGDWASIRVLAKNRTATASVYLDGDDQIDPTTDAFEWELSDGPYFEISLEPGEALYGRLAAGAAAQTLHVLRQGR